MARRGENIYKRKDGRWEGRYAKDHIGGKVRYGYIYARTYKEVKARLSKVLKTIDEPEGKSLYIDSEYPEKLSSESFSALAEEWFTLLEAQLKESSIVKYTNILNSYLLPVFRQKQIVDITRDDIIEFSKILLAEGGVKKEGLSPKTVSDIISVIKSIIEYASKVKGYSVIDVRGIYVKQAQRPLRVLSSMEQQVLEQYLYADLTLCNLGILLCLYTGLRVGEICALKWGDISFDEQYLYVQRTMQRIQKTNMDDGENGNKTMILISVPKSDSSIRKVPIPDKIFQLITEFKNSPDANFLTGTAYSYIEPRTMQNRFKKVIKDCNLYKVNFHALRHTFATRCIELGFDVKSLSEILGHANVNITLNCYVHPSMELKQRNMNMLSNLFSVR